MDSEGQRTGQGHGGDLGGGSEEGSVDDCYLADCGPMSAKAAEAVGAADGKAAQAQGPPPAPASCGDGAPVTDPSGDQEFQYSLTLPILSFLETYLVCRILHRVTETFEGAVHKEIAVNDSNLIIHLRAVDPFLLKVAATLLLGRLYLLFQELLRFWRHLFRKLNHSQR